MNRPLALAAGVASALATRVASAQGDSMMGGGHWGGAWMSGYGVAGTAVLLAVVVALVAWIVVRRRK